MHSNKRLQSTDIVVVEDERKQRKERRRAAALAYTLFYSTRRLAADGRTETGVNDASTAPPSSQLFD